MSAAPETKYTDRDVRENEDLRDLAIAYLKEYRGDFEPLTDAQEVLASGEPLATATIRKVLNCMRHDARVAKSLPRPQGNVFQFRPRQELGRVFRQYQCGDPNYHEPHSPEYRGEKYSCPGQPHKINRRTETIMPTRIKSDFIFALAPQGRLIHRIDPDAEHYVAWLPNRHSWGWNYENITHSGVDAVLTVKTLCKNPGKVRYPILLTEPQAADYLGDLNIGGLEIEWCDRCWAIHGFSA